MVGLAKAKAIAGEMVEIHVGLCYGKQNSMIIIIAVSVVVDDWFVRVLRPSDISCEREEVVESERERVF